MTPRESTEAAIASALAGLEAEGHDRIAVMAELRAYAYAFDFGASLEEARRDSALAVQRTRAAMAGMNRSERRAAAARDRRQG